MKFAVLSAASSLVVKSHSEEADVPQEPHPPSESVQFAHNRSLFGNFVSGPSLSSNIQSFEDEIKHYHARSESPFFQDLQDPRYRSLDLVEEPSEQVPTCASGSSFPLHQLHVCPL
jgi:hypothetical protein